MGSHKVYLNFQAQIAYMANLLKDLSSANLKLDATLLKVIKK